MRKSTFSALRWTTASTLGKTALQFIQVVVLARILTPADFGLIALVVAVVTFLQGISDLGVSSAIVHHQDTTTSELSSLYWLNLGVAVSLSILIIAVSPIAAWFYMEPRLEHLMDWAGLSLTTSAIGQQLRSRAERDLRFGPLARLELVSAILGFSTAVAVALLSHSAFALVIGLLVSSLSSSLLSWLLLADGWRPVLSFNWFETRRFLSFGGFATLSNLVGMINMQIDVAIGGRVFGAAGLGAYGMARDLSLKLASVTNPIATRVGMPLMARDHANKVHVGKVYARTIEILAALNFPLYLGVAVFAPDVIAFLFGAKWQSSGQLLRALSVWGMVRSMLNPVGALLYACGRVKTSFHWNLSLAVLGIPLFLVGSQWGAEGLAVTQLIFMAAVFMPAWKFLVQPDTGLGALAYVCLMGRPLVLSALSVAFAWLVVLPLEQSAIRLTVALAVGGAIYVALSLGWNRSWLNDLQGIAGQKR